MFIPGHVVSELRGVRFSGFLFEWDMAYNNLPSASVQAVKNRWVVVSFLLVFYTCSSSYYHRSRLIIDFCFSIIRPEV
jgi:hypothetical protein